MILPVPMSARALLELKFTEPKWAVPGVIPEGLFLVAARPKMGKSWLMLNLAVAVAAGGHALGQIRVRGGDVLYLALEDTARRLQSRLVTMLEDGAEAPERLALQTSWPRLDAGGLEGIAEWLEVHPDARLVVVDTLAKVKPRSKRRDSSLYDDDYDSLAGLKTLADEHAVAVGVVHHQRKMGADNPFDTISGTLGLTAGPDTILVLERAKGDASGAILHLTGRDVEEQKYRLHWDAGIGSWSMVDTPVADVSSSRQEILDALLGMPGVGRPSAVADWIKRSRGSVRKLMWEMAETARSSAMGSAGTSYQQL